ncbi:EF-hand domain-containing protein [Sphingomonas sp.]|uniref:EF-hand domain-containing protein n=1 Tax=Sphingomonas sp. TaxID=28214 RepID=UPI0035C79517
MRTLTLSAIAASLVAATPAAAQDMSAADANRDGRITRAEFGAARMANFSRMDRNRDGVLSQVDADRIARFRSRASFALRQVITTADANRDGVVTRAELSAAPMPAFDRADGNHDGVVDRNEMAALRAAFAEMRS